MAQQTARYLLGCYKKVINGKRLSDSSTTYLNDYKTLLNQKKLHHEIKCEEDLYSFSNLLEIWKLLAVHSIHHTNERLQTEIVNKGNKSEGWNECMMDLVNCAYVHNYLIVFHHFVNAIESLSSQQRAIRVLLSKLCTVFGLQYLENKWGNLLEYEILNKQHGIMIRNLKRKLINELTPEAVSLVDSFNLPDFIINSPLGRYGKKKMSLKIFSNLLKIKDGDIYTYYMKALKESTNQTPPPYFDSLIKPLTSKL